MLTANVHHQRHLVLMSERKTAGKSDILSCPRSLQNPTPPLNTLSLMMPVLYGPGHLTIRQSILYQMAIEHYLLGTLEI